MLEEIDMFDASKLVLRALLWTVFYLVLFALAVVALYLAGPH